MYRLPVACAAAPTPHYRAASSRRDTTPTEQLSRIQSKSRINVGAERWSGKESTTDCTLYGLLQPHTSRAPSSLRDPPAPQQLLFFFCYKGTRTAVPPAVRFRSHGFRAPINIGVRRVMVLQARGLGVDCWWHGRICDMLRRRLCMPAHNDQEE